ncbi:hypothetical protein CH267_00960 [Rhodococcus sp. 06-621-2]|nr:MULTISPECIES: hypothetical protein [unclassified Rhodococcus (in: high G+C Gram-positive bacteria)]OZC62143.1 hypothetical protein CH267_00960 [Rhodococcus sp. 06-621-2]OZF09817.1 hypothetical protein CH300_00100 [Rhodococcus sp. 15-1154-1]
MARMTPKIFKKINNAPAVRARQEARARLIAATAQSITSSEGGQARFRIESGIRPGGRSYTNVVSSSAAEEYGNETTPRIRALGRAMRATK